MRLTPEHVAGRIEAVIARCMSASGDGMDAIS